MKVPAAKLRQNLYRLLDEVLKTGVPLEVERKGKILKIVPEKQKSKLGKLKFHDVIVGAPEDIIDIEWIKEWNEGKHLS